MPVRGFLATVNVCRKILICSAFHTFVHSCHDLLAMSGPKHAMGRNVACLKTLVPLEQQRQQKVTGTQKAQMRDSTKALSRLSFFKCNSTSCPQRARTCPPNPEPPRGIALGRHRSKSTASLAFSFLVVCVIVFNARVYRSSPKGGERARY